MLDLQAQSSAAQDSLCLDHTLLRLAAWRRYDPWAAPLSDVKSAEELEEEKAAEEEAMRKKKLGPVDLEGYVWVRARVWASVMDDDDGVEKLEVELLVTEQSALSVIKMPMFHVRKIPLPAVKKAKVKTVEVQHEEEGVELARPGFVATVPRGLAQAWPFVDAHDDDAMQPLLSTTAHASDESHLMATVQRGFPVVPEKRYALTPFSAQTLVRKGTVPRLDGDRWTRTGGMNPGPPSGLYPRKGGGARGGLQANPHAVRARALAGVWGRPAAAPAVDLVRPTASRARERMKSYEKKKRTEMFG